MILRIERSRQQITKYVGVQKAFESLCPQDEKRGFFRQQARIRPKIEFWGLPSALYLHTLHIQLLGPQCPGNRSKITEISLLTLFIILK